MYIFFAGFKCTILFLEIHSLFNLGKIVLCSEHFLRLICHFTIVRVWTEVLLVVSEDQLDIPGPQFVCIEITTILSLHVHPSGSSSRAASPSVKMVTYVFVLAVPFHLFHLNFSP